MFSIPAVRRSWVCLLPLAMVFQSCGSGDEPEPTDPSPVLFTYTLDPGVAPREARFADPSIVVAGIEDADGVRSEFIEDEVLIEPRSQGELDEFLKFTGGEIVHTDQIPAPPAGHDIAFDQTAAKPRLYTIRVDREKLTDSMDLANLPSYAETFGIKGAFRISSENAARLIALTAFGNTRGLALSPNYVFTSTSEILNSSSENAGFDLFGAAPFRSDGSATNMVGAWQYMAAREGTWRGVGVAILDGGYWLDADGVPESWNLIGVSDFPISPIQHDFNADQHTVTGTNPNLCTGGNACPWHGNSCAGVATAWTNDGFGSSGTGGQVAYPMLFQLRLTTGQIASAVRTAVAWNARVISMSFSGACDASCRKYKQKHGYYKAFQEAINHGVVLVSSAGNNNQDVVAHSILPCVDGRVICVGATFNNSLNAQEYSNYGSTVAIWAPSDIPTTPNADTWPNLSWAGGTSSSTPFVAGITAMLKFINPSLTPTQVLDILQSTATPAHPATNGPKVTSTVNALAAVLMAGDQRLHPDSYEPNDWPGQASPLTPGLPLTGLTLHTKGDVDHFTFPVEEYGQLDIIIDFPTHLGVMEVEVVPPTGKVAPAGVQIHQSPGQVHYQARTVSPGDYLIVLKNNQVPTLYNLSVQTTPANLPQDVFEPNNSKAQATENPRGTYSVTFHYSHDMDIYKFFLPLDVRMGLRQFHFEVLQSEIAYSTEWLDENYNHLTPESDLPETLYIRLWPKDAVLGRYLFTTGIATQENLLSEYYEKYNEFWWLDPGDPISILLDKLDVLYLLDASLLDISEIILTGEGLTMELLDRNGNTLAEGEPVSFPNSPATGERIGLQGIPSGDLRALRIMRKDLLLPQGEGHAVVQVPGFVEGSVQIR